MNSIVIYFSPSGTTKNVSNKIASILNTITYEIKPLVPYSLSDLNWMDKASRSSVEMSDLKSRPAIIKDNISFSEYDVIYLGFPIWWGIAPTIVNTFLESYNFSGKTIKLFATSGGSGFGDTKDKLAVSLPSDVNLIDGRIISTNITEEELSAWINS